MQKQRQNHLRTNTPTRQIFLKKVAQKIILFCATISPVCHSKSPVSPNPLYLTSKRFPTATPITPGSAFHHPVLDPHVSPLLLPWPPRVSPSWKNGPQDGKMEAKIIKIVSEVTTISGKPIKTNLKKPTCFRTFHRKTKPLKTTSNQ